MMMKEISKYLKEIKAVLEDAVPGAEIILFGSQARGDARKDSDIDILVLVDAPKFTYEMKGIVLDVLFSIEMKYLIAINPVMRTRNEWFNQPFRTPFYINVMNEGIRI